MNNLLSKSILSCLCAILLYSCEETNYKRNLDSIPLATDAQINDWEFAQNSLLGIKANDPVNSSPTPNEKGAWTLAYPQKQHIAGRFNRYGAYDEEKIIGDFQAFDWNLMIHVSNEFRYLYDPIYESDYSDDWMGCLSPGDTCGDDTNNSPCMWAEIAPYIDIVRGERWFVMTNNKDHCSAGKYIDKQDTICVYGPFVQDDEHGDQPEIHPAQQFWFRNNQEQAGPSEHFLLFFLQDASRRFEEWVAPPLYGQYLIAFRVKPKRTSNTINTNTPLTINISMLEKYELVTSKFSPYRVDSDNGSTHTLEINGQNMVVVNEPENTMDDQNLGVQFVDLCKLADGTVQGYVQISMVIDDPNSAPYGACILGVEIVPGKNAAPPIKQIN